MDDPLVEFAQDPGRPTLDNVTDAGHPFSVPWSHEVRPILSGFQSELMTTKEGPWILSSPFSASDAKLLAVIPETNGGKASYRDGYSTSTGQNTEHLSAALGITVGYPFLNASVTGKYDKHVVENSNGVRASRNSTVRMGRIMLAESPRLSPEALAMFRSQEGLALFKRTYGDYFVCGYEIGADAGASMSASTKSMSKSESLEITIAIKILFVTASKTFRKTSYESSTSASISFCGYSSLEPNTQQMTIEKTTPSELARLQETTGTYLLKVAALDGEVRERMSRLRLEDGIQMTLSSCTDLCKSGLVVELLLAPYARLNEVVAQLS